jgi:hypothetical protein
MATALPAAASPPRPMRLGLFDVVEEAEHALLE